MDKELIAATLKKVKENSPKKNFKQSIDLIINLKGLDLKKTEHNVNMFVTLQHSTGKKVSVCALVGPELESKAKEVCEETILSDKFDVFKKAEVKKLASKYDFFIAQASLMPKVATVFGRYLGPRGKMPNPKIGSILPPNANVKPLYEKLVRTVNILTKNEPTIKCRVGQEDTIDNEVIDNILTVYNSVIPKLPNETQNVKNIMLKLTMGPAFVVGKDEEETGKIKDKKSKAKIKSKEQESKEKTIEKKPAIQEKVKPQGTNKPSKETEKGLEMSETFQKEPKIESKLKKETKSSDSKK